MNARTDLAPILDMVEMAERAIRYGSGFDPQTLAADELRCDALLRVVSVLGEASTRVSEVTRKRFPDLPWKEMRGMRNIVMHNYDNIDLAIVCEVSAVHIPALMPALLAARDVLIAEEPLPESPDGITRTEV